MFQITDTSPASLKKLSDYINKLESMAYDQNGDALRDNAVIRRNIAPGAVGTDEIGPFAITVPLIANSAVIAEKIAEDAVIGDEYDDLGQFVKAGKLAADSVHSRNIVSDAILANHISSGAVETDSLAANAVTAAKIMAHTITANEIKVNELIVGTNVLMGSNATINWANVTSQPTIPTTAAQVGALPASTVIPTQYTDSQALAAWVASGYKTYINSSGVYTGTLTASQINAISGITLGSGASINWSYVTPPTATQVGARPSSWTPTAVQVGALANTWVGTTYFDENGIYSGTIVGNQIYGGTIDGVTITGATILAKDLIAIGASNSYANPTINFQNKDVPAVSQISVGNESGYAGNLGDKMYIQLISNDNSRGSVKFYGVPIPDDHSTDVDVIVQGTLAITDTVTIRGTQCNAWASDISLKKNIIDYKGSSTLDKIMAINHREFDWKENDTHVSIGYVSQELQKIDKNMVFEVKQQDGKPSLYQPDIAILIPIITKAMQEMQKEINDLKSKIA